MLSSPIGLPSTAWQSSYPSRDHYGAPSWGAEHGTGAGERRRMPDFSQARRTSPRYGILYARRQARRRPMAITRQGLTLEAFLRLHDKKPALEYKADGTVTQKVAPQ